MSDELDYSEPFRIKIIEDCREPRGRLNGQYGTCLGLYEFLHNDRKLPAGVQPNDPLEYNPLILTDTGEYIWGIECWFVREEDAKGIPDDILKDAAEVEKYLLNSFLNSPGGKN